VLQLAVFSCRHRPHRQVWAARVPKTPALAARRGVLSRGSPRTDNSMAIKVFPKKVDDGVLRLAKRQHMPTSVV
jgi:hypothetical protein